MVLTNLKMIYSQITRLNMTFCIFPFQKNKVKFDVYFDIKDSPFKLGFIAKNTNLSIWFDIQRGFIIDCRLSKEQYYLLCKILNLKKASEENPFSTSAFFDEFNNAIPNKLQPLELYRDTIIHVAINKYSIEEPDKLYYYGKIDWDLPQNIGKGRRSNENLEKTRILYPEIYEIIKDKNISIKYTKDQSYNVFELA